MKKLFFTAIAMVAFSSVSMASSIEIKGFDVDLKKQVETSTQNLESHVNIIFPTGLFDLIKACVKVADKVVDTCLQTGNPQVMMNAGSIAQAAFVECLSS